MKFWIYKPRTVFGQTSTNPEPPFTLQALLYSVCYSLSGLSGLSGSPQLKSILAAANWHRRLVPLCEMHIVCSSSVGCVVGIVDW